MVLCSAKVKLIQGCCGDNSWRFRAQRINRFKWKSSLLTMLFVPNPAPENLGKQTFTWWRNAISAVPHISPVSAYSRGFPKQNFPCWSGTQQLPWQETKLWRNQSSSASGRTHSWKLCITQKIPSFSASYFTCLTFFLLIFHPQCSDSPGKWWSHHPWNCSCGFSWCILLGLEVFGQKSDWMILEIFSNIILWFHDPLGMWECQTSPAPGTLPLS